MLALRGVVEIEKRNFAEKLYYKWILTFNILNKFIIARFAPVLSQSLVSSIYFISISLPHFHNHLVPLLTTMKVLRSSLLFSWSNRRFKPLLYPARVS
jgi:hypothetical protein